MTVDETRVQRLNKAPLNDTGRYVVYWMQASQRVADNHALAFAIEQANRLHQPLLVFFGLVPAYLGARAPQYRFMLQGLYEVGRALQEQGIGFVLQRGSPERLIVEHARDARCVVVDRGYLRHQKRWYRFAAHHLECPLFQVETNVIVPVEVASDKEEYAARTFRPRISAHLERYLAPVQLSDVSVAGDDPDLDTLDWANPETLLLSLGLDPTSIPATTRFRGGTEAARQLLTEFVTSKLADYERRNHPDLDVTSHMSPYLHFGQISPMEIALRVRATELETVDAYLEELVVRRELAVNMVHYNPDYDTLDVLPEWAQSTLMERADDPREWHYTLAELEAGRTHDLYWNSAQRQMVLTGTMHGYMRMYWGKKILEWSPDPSTALARMLYLNDAYELDGRDPNGYAGAAWCLGKHDQAWKERPIYGKVRYMNDRGLERKFDIERYVQQIASLEDDTAEP